MTNEVQWEKHAQTDREQIFLFLLQQAGLQVACATDEKFVRMAGLLEAHPHTGVKVGSVEQQRKLVIPRFPFIIIYVIDREIVRILRVVHTSREISRRFNRG